MRLTQKDDQQKRQAGGCQKKGPAADRDDTSHGPGSHSGVPVSKRASLDQQNL
jgi:hypothetical protein